MDIQQYNSNTIRTQYTIENNNKIKMHSFFVVPENRQPLLGMPAIETLGILIINCNTLEMKESDGPENCKMTKW